MASILSRNLPRLFALLALTLIPATGLRGQSFFKRADVNVDGQVNIGDPVATLGFLFLGNPKTIDCEDAADFDDNGVLELTDPVALLSYLFLGGGDPAEPFAQCGLDTTRDTLPCASFAFCQTPLNRSSKSSTIAISNDDLTVAMVNPEDGSISIFSTLDNKLRARVPTGAEPSAVVIHPNTTTAFVANRAEATVVKVAGIDTENPSVVARLDVGSEPAGLALSPTGARLFVAEFAEGRVAVIDTKSMELVGSIENPKNPRALAVTNDGDVDDDDELLIVPEYFGEPVPGQESKDTGRTGRVRIYKLSDLSPTQAITFAPIDSGFVPDGSAEGTPTVQTSPNQLAAVAVDKNKIYVTSVSASPAPPIKFNGNVYPVVYVGDLASRAEDRSNVGTTNLARKVADQLGAGTVRFFLADLVDIDFFGQNGVAYALARGADVLQRVVYDPAKGVTIGSSNNVQIDLLKVGDGAEGCLNPTGVVTAHAGARAYLNCWVNRRLGVIDLSVQALATTVEAAPIPESETSVKNGRRFYFTGRARWSKDAWSSCGSCHPDGLTDNITWSFGAGPRQSTSMDGSFSHGPGPQKQRIFNWTGIFEEMHDFERNTRGVSGGLGAITTSPTGLCGTLAEEVQDPATAALPGNLAQPVKELQDRPENCRKDWDAVDAFVKTIRPPRGLRYLDAASVSRGAVLFGEPSVVGNNGGCVRCHGGAGWTVSRRFWEPSTTTNADLASAELGLFVKPPFWPASWNLHARQIEPQPPAADNTGSPVAPAQVSCVIRDLDTFGLPGDPTGTDALEKKDNGTRAQGAGGYNVPSLYGLAVGAPYLHHGQAQSLEELFTDSRWSAHLTAGNPNFLASGNAEQDREDLINFLLSIDAGTGEQPIPPGWDGCPLVFPSL
jgi:DNA-binding beta-propeller fold protein YncE/cytochrome c peroxidase